MKHTLKIVLVEYGEDNPSLVLYSCVVKKLKEIAKNLENRHPSTFHQ